jgi:hypothetical protein
MDYSSFKKQLDNLDEIIKNRISEDRREPIYDGAINPERYFKSPIKIAWLLKEAYDDLNGEGGGWCYSELLDKENVYEDFFRPHGSRATWHPIIYVSYGILNNFMFWGSMDYIRDEPEEMTSIVRDIAIVNVQKLPSKNVSKTDFQDIVKAFNKYKDILKSQIEILNPDILICANTMQLYKELFDLTSEKINTKESITYYTKNEKLYIDAYHPAQTQVYRETYVDDIITAAKEWHELFK